MHETDIINALRNGDTYALKHAIDLYGKRLQNAVLNIVQSREDAEEIIQDVFVEMFHSIDKFQEKSALSTWLYSIAIRKAIDHVRAKKRKKRFAFVYSLFGRNDELIHDSPDFVHPGVQLEEKENALLLFKALDELPEKQKSAFVLKRLEGLSQREIAAILNTSEGAVESLLSRAKEALTKKLENYLK